MNLLLDTHTLLWWLDDDAALSEPARAAIADPGNTVFLSAAVVWELRIKQAIGKVDLPGDFRGVLEAQQFVELPVRADHVHGLAELPPIHRDFFDRLLVAQARAEGMTIVTRDPEIARYDVRVLAA